MKWKNKYNYAVIGASSIAFVLGAAYSLLPFFSSKEFLVKHAQQDLKQFEKSGKTIEDKRYTFIKRKSGVSCAHSKYTTYTICTGERS